MANKKFKTKTIGQPDTYLPSMDSDNSDNMSLNKLKVNTVTSTGNLALDAAIGSIISLGKQLQANNGITTGTGNLSLDAAVGSIISLGKQLQALSGIVTNTVTSTGNFSLNASTYMATISGYGRIASPTQTIRSAGSESLDCSTQHIFYKTGGTATITLSNLVEGQTINLILQSTGSAYTITWSPTIIWGPVGIPTPTATASKYDFYTFIKVGTMIFGAVILSMA